MAKARSLTPIRPLGTMIAYGFPRGHLDTDLAIAEQLGAVCLEVLPDWRALPDPIALRKRVAKAGLILHSAHGCWGGQSIEARRVDLGDPDPVIRQASVNDLRRCLDWLGEAGGTYLVVHPGGLSAPDLQSARRDALAESLRTLADHAQKGGLVVCVENMPPGVHPGSRMADLAALVAELDRPELALALDTGHAHLNASPASETLAAGRLLRTTHVHDNNGRQDTHEPPGRGTVDWADWVKALDAIGYNGPIMLECIRHLRENPDSLDGPLLERLARLTVIDDGTRS
ncbi:MAG: sugar phosphate isomerase/epimerase family protein [Isosphaeraceae bacterium]